MTVTKDFGKGRERLLQCLDTLVLLGLGGFSFGLTLTQLEYKVWVGKGDAEYGLLRFLAFDCRISDLRFNENKFDSLSFNLDFV